jgi:DNA replication protein DnaC
MPTEHIKYHLSKVYQKLVLERNPYYEDIPADVIDTVADFLHGDRSRIGLYIQGSYGTGKSTLARTLQYATNILYQHKPEALIGSDGIRIVHAKEIAKAKDLDGIKKCQCLVIDDLGTEPTVTLNFGNADTPIIDIIEYRYDNRLPTIITTNLPAKDIRPKYGDRIADRFLEMMNIITMTGQSYRNKMPI